MTRGFTLPELVSALGIIAVVTAVALPPIGRALDRAAVSEGVQRFSAAHAATRQLAVTESVLARLELDAARRLATVSLRRTAERWDTVARFSLGTATVTCSNSSLTFSPLGLGYGLSNTRIVFSRGGAADTLTTSRTGRLHR